MTKTLTRLQDKTLKDKKYKLHIFMWTGL